LLPEPRLLRAEFRDRRLRGYRLGDDLAVVSLKEEGVGDGFAHDSKRERSLGDLCVQGLGVVRSRWI
jgi:hypothetical protein